MEWYRREFTDLLPVFWSFLPHLYFNAKLVADLFIYLFIYLFAVLGLEIRVFTLSHSTSPIFVNSFSEIESLVLFAWASFKQ
jgi:nitrate reductase gamma subunit